MRVTLVPQGRDVEIAERLRVRELLERLGLVPGTVLVIRGTELVPDEGVLEPDDTVEIRSVVSGGV